MFFCRVTDPCMHTLHLLNSDIGGIWNAEQSGDVTAQNILQEPQRCRTEGLGDNCYCCSYRLPTRLRGQGGELLSEPTAFQWLGGWWFTST